MDRRSTLQWLFAAPLACISSFAKGEESSLTLKTDKQLQFARENPQSLMFSDQVVESVHPHTFIKVRSIASSEQGRYLELRPGTMRIFRADSSKTTDGKGELRWTIGSEERVTHIKEPDAVIMAVRSLDGTVSWYSLQYDFRC